MKPYNVVANAGHSKSSSSSSLGENRGDAGGVASPFPRASLRGDYREYLEYRELDSQHLDSQQMVERNSLEQLRENLMQLEIMQARFSFMVREISALLR